MSLDYFILISAQRNHIIRGVEYLALGPDGFSKGDQALKETSQ